jgi:hypothetical protein
MLCTGEAALMQNLRARHALIEGEWLGMPIAHGDYGQQQRRPSVQSIVREG